MKIENSLEINLTAGNWILDVDRFDLRKKQ